ncbi:MAG: hypothetical protein GY715_11005 [Planctomycetes bacterium]|nr:hypothetical protein [Planctomycetota bacterium]
MRTASVVFLLVLVALTGCQNPGGGGRVPPPAHTDGTARWPFWPTDMRVHPLTRITTNEDGAEVVIEARLELVDSDGHTTKGTGVIECELVPRGTNERVAYWKLDLGDLTVNRERYDEVTRTYLLRLELDDQALLPERPELRAQFKSADGQVFRATLVLRWH